MCIGGYPFTGKDIEYPETGTEKKALSQEAVPKLDVSPINTPSSEKKDFDELGHA